MSRVALERFGTYYLLDQIAEGGMAEIFRARHARIDANGQVLVIKRILPHVAKDSRFIEMFKAETRVCMGFSHPNTIQIFSFGDFQDVHFIAMEYVEGKTVSQILRTNAKSANPLPISISVGIAFLTACGLEYVHNFENRATGENLKVIHRDISPENILVSYGGGVKLIDFGIAKIMVDQPGKTLPGVIKGKASYFSPEQARGLPLDGRSDIFSLGIVLWELLTGRRLFFSPTRDMLGLVDTIRNCEAIEPPSRFNPAVPKSLDQLVLKCLEINPDQRFRSASDVRAGLEGILRELGQRAVGPHLSAFMKELFTDEMQLERSSLHALNNAAQVKLAEEMVPEVTNHGFRFPIRETFATLKQVIEAAAMALLLAVVLAVGYLYLRGEQIPRVALPDIRTAAPASPRPREQIRKTRADAPRRQVAERRDTRRGPAQSNRARRLASD